MSVVVTFRDVGRGKRNWTATLPAFDALLLEREVRKNGGLMSQAIDVDWDTEKQEGAILVGGFRRVGTFTATDATPADA